MAHPGYASIFNRNHNYSILRLKGHEQGPQAWSIYLIYTLVGVYLIQSEVEDNQTRKQVWIDTKMLINSNGSKSHCQGQCH